MFTVLYINRRGYYANDGTVLPMLRTKLSDTKSYTVGDQLIGDLVATICHRGDDLAGHWLTYSKVDSDNVFYLNDDSYRVTQSSYHPFNSSDSTETCDVLLYRN